MDRHLKCPFFESGDQIQIYIMKNKYYKIDIKYHVNNRLDKNMSQLVINKLYQFTITNFNFGELPKTSVIKILNDGRVFSHFIERYISEIWFENLTHITGNKPYDFIDYANNEQKYDEKTFTNKGCKFMPSGMLGKGRKYSKEDYEKYLKETNMKYIIVDNTDLNNNKIRVKAFNGIDLFKCFPNASIPISCKDYIFSDKELNINTLNEYKMIQQTGKKRNTIDKFYTNPNIVNKYIQKFIPFIEKNDLIIEPSAGSGVWTTPLHEYNLLAFDIQPEGEGIQEKNFLDLNLYSFQNKLHFIGNPPFGRQASLAKKFIKHMVKCENTQTIGFILPKSFKKISFQKVFPLNFHLEYQDDIEKNAFLANGKPHDVPCVFQIWKKKNINRIVPKELKPKGYKFVKKENNHDYSLRRVGVYAGKISDDTDNKSFQSHYFIKLDEGDKKFIDKYNNAINFEHNNTVGPKSISKQEFIQVLNGLF
jgi:hypothetical protein